jgi:hypothetical protein
MLEVSEGASRFQFIMHKRFVFSRLDLIENGRQLLVFRHDLLRRLVRDMWVAGEHDGNRLADKMYFANGQDRLVVKCRPVIGIGNDFSHVVTGIDSIHAGYLAGGVGID